MFKFLGKNPSGARLERIKRSKYYVDGAFRNLEKTEVMHENASIFGMLRESLTRPVTVRPPKELPFVITDLKNIQADKPTLVWFGHSSYFLQSNGFKILVDPVFSGYAAPLPFLVKAFKGSNVYQPEDFPEIDLLVLTHDHYDHLDYKTVSKFKNSVKKVLTPLGTGAHLEHWGFDSDKIVELDWDESVQIANGVGLTAVLGRHFSGRTFRRGKTLWASFVLEIHGYKIYIGGDSGYGTHFKVIGEKYGPFDLAMLESGQYDKSWPFIHMAPEQTLQAAKELGAKVLVPVHWGKFILANHPWNDPVKRITAANIDGAVEVITPKIGQIYTLGDHNSAAKWWDFS